MVNRTIVQQKHTIFWKNDKGYERNADTPCSIGTPKLLVRRISVSGHRSFRLVQLLVGRCYVPDLFDFFPVLCIEVDTVVARIKGNLGGVLRFIFSSFKNRITHGA